MIKIGDSEVKNVLFNGNNCKEVYFNGKLVFKFEFTLFDKILADNVIKTDMPDFSKAPTDAESGVYQAEDDQGTVYYFRGNITNNWVKFAGFYWRIIRTNGDGSVRLLYVGASANTTAGYISTSAFNNESSNPIHAGYMYGSMGSLESNRQNTKDSTIKTVVDNWYKTNIFDKGFDDYVSKNAIYINDRSGDDYEIGVIMYYAAKNRIESNKKPSYKYGNNPDGSLYGDTSNADKFTKSTTTGNGKLTYPIALMTADEVTFAGGVCNLNSTAWYYYNSVGSSVTYTKSWWTMSPKSAGKDSASMYCVHGLSLPGQLTGANVNSTVRVIRPVISLKKEVLTTGNGTAEDPYIVG